MITLNHKQALRSIHDGLRDLRVDWAITGSLALALHGLEVHPGDIDIQTDRDGAYRIEAVFSGSIVRQVKFVVSPQIKSHFGELLVDGVTVELMGALQKRLSNETWEQPIDVTMHREFREHDGMRVPVLTFETQSIALVPTPAPGVGTATPWLTREESANRCSSSVRIDQRRTRQMIRVPEGRNADILRIDKSFFSLGEIDLQKGS